MNIYQAIIQTGRIYFAFIRQGPIAQKYQSGNLPATQWVVIIVTYVTTSLQNNGYRATSGAFVEVKGFVDTSSIAHDTAAFYPVASADAAGNAGAFCPPS